MSLLVPTPSEKLTKLGEDSTKIMSVFEKTAIDLEAVNIKIRDEQDVIDSQITLLQANKADADIVLGHNKKVADKIRDFLN